MSMKVVLDGQSLHEVKQFTFNDGSEQIEILGDLPAMAQHVIVEAIVRTPADQMALVLLKSSIDSMFPLAEVHLVMPFCPYGRQDQSFIRGQANGMKAWAGLVNHLNFATVAVMDPHSIAVNHINNLFEVNITDILSASSEFMELFLGPDMTLVSPDAGANKKAHKIAQKYGFTKLVRADKARDLATGEIIETELYGDVEGDTCLIVDDICDGGMTFIKLAEKLKEAGAEKVILFVTHGLFTKGLSVFEGLIDEIYTTDTWIRDEGIEDGYTGKFVVCSGQQAGS